MRGEKITAGVRECIFVTGLRPLALNAHSNDKAEILFRFDRSNTSYGGGAFRLRQPRCIQSPRGRLWEDGQLRPETHAKIKQMRKGQMERRDTYGRPSRLMVTEEFGVDLVHVGEVFHALQEDLAENHLFIYRRHAQREEGGTYGGLGDLIHGAT